MALPTITNFPYLSVFKAGLRLRPNPVDPANVTDGQIWYNSEDDQLKARVNGSTVQLGAAGITELTGDVTASSVGSAAATIANDAVTYAKMQNVSAASKLLGRGSSGGAGNVEEITLGTGLTMTGTTLASAGGRWTLIENRAASGTTEEFINLSAYDEIMFIVSAVTNASNSIIQVRVSTDNGSNYLSASGSYKAIAFDDPAGVNKTEMAMHTSTTTLAKNLLFTLTALSHVSPKFAWAQQYVGAGAGATGVYFIPGTDPINALQLINSGGDFNGGNFYIFGR